MRIWLCCCRAREAAPAQQGLERPEVWALGNGALGVGSWLPTPLLKDLGELPGLWLLRLSPDQYSLGSASSERILIVSILSSINSCGGKSVSVSHSALGPGHHSPGIETPSMGDLRLL